MLKVSLTLYYLIYTTYFFICQEKNAKKEHRDTFCTQFGLLSIKILLLTKRKQSNYKAQRCRGAKAQSGKSAKAQSGKVAKAQRTL